MRSGDKLVDTRLALLVMGPRKTVPIYAFPVEDVARQAARTWRHAAWTVELARILRRLD
jgi:hypothetical protein